MAPEPSSPGGTVLERARRFNLRRALPVVGVVAAVGIALVWRGFAAGTPIAFEPEAGSVAAPAKTVANAGASGGSAVQFAAAGTPTPTPTPTPVGGRTCPAYPLPPDASCTGVPAGTSLTTVSGNLSTSTNGQTITGKLITGDLIVGNSNITVTNTRIMGRVVNNASNGLTVTDSDIGPAACPATSSPYNNFNGTNYTLVRSHVHNAGADLMGMGGSGTILIKDSIVDQACYYPGDHLDAIQFYSPGDIGKVTIDHTVLDSRAVNVSALGNAAIFWADNPGSGSSLTATHSFFAGGNYTASLYDATAGSGVVFDINNNTFINNTWTYGPCNKANSILFDGTSGLKFTNNVYDTGGAVSGC